MNRRTSSLVLTLVAVGIGGCSSLIPEPKKIDYKSAVRAPTLEVPPDLTQLARDDRFSVPDTSGKGKASWIDYSAERAPGASPQNSPILPTIDNVRVERAGNQRWLVASIPNERLWGSVKDFWQELGFVIVTEIPEAGIMETDWAENRAKIPSDIIRNTLGKLLDSLYSSGERDKFRTRFEPGSTPGTTDIFISNRRMEEVYTSSAQDDTRWQPAAPDAELEAEMLRRLMVRLGTDERRAEAQIAAARTEEKAKFIKTSDGTASLELQERFDRAWRRVGLVLDRVGFTVEDRDRSQGVYFVRYVDPDQDGKKKEDGWLSRLAVWKNTKEVPKVQYRIQIQEENGVSLIRVLRPEGVTDQSDTARKILDLLYEQLK